MEITKTLNGNTLTVSLKGNLDTVTSPELQSYMDANLGEATKLVLDFKDLAYISSAGLRLVLLLAKTMKAKEGMVISGCNDTVKDIFRMTGFDKMLQFQE